MLKHVMDGDTQEDRLDLLEPVVEDWHTLQSFLGVGVCVCVYVCVYVCFPLVSGVT